MEPGSFDGLTANNNNNDQWKMKIKNCRLPTIESGAFSGIAHMADLWVTNVTVGQIKENAFSGLRDVQYLYFHQTRVL